MLGSIFGKSKIPGRSAVLIIFAVCLFGGISFASERAEKWVELGPAPIGDLRTTGRISALAVSRSDPNLYYAAGADGGVWRSRNGGESWIPLTDNLPTTAMGALALDPKDERIIYAGSGEANFANHSRFGLGIYKSTDGGDTWTVLGEEIFGGRCISRILIDFDNTKIVYAAVTHAGGLPSFDFNMAAAKGHPQAGGPLGVFRSKDGGRTWEHLTNGLPGDLSVTDLAMDATDPLTLYAGVGHVFGHNLNGVYKTVNGGDSWVRLDELSAGNFGRISLGMTPADPKYIYACLIKAATPTGDEAETLNVYRSLDAGDTWTAMTLDSIHSTYGWYLNTLVVGRQNPDLVFTGGIALWRTEDGGYSWDDVRKNQHVDFHALVWDASGRLLAGNDGGIFRSADNGETWTPLNEGLGIVQFYAGLSLHPTNPDVLFGGTQDNGTLKRNGPAKDNWISVAGRDGGCTGIKPSYPDLVLVETQGSGNIYRSADGGEHFVFSGRKININDRNCFIPPFVFDSENDNRLLYATHRIYESINNGIHWYILSDDLTLGKGAVRSLVLAPSRSSFVYAATNDGLILVSSDGGRTWQKSLENIPGWPRIQRQFAVHPQEHLEAYLAVGWFGVDQVLKTADGGKTWICIDGDLPDLPVNIVTLDERTDPPVIYLGTEKGVYRSYDGGAHWAVYGTGLPNCAVVDLLIDKDHSRLLAATQGRGVWEIPLTVFVE